MQIQHSSQFMKARYQRQVGLVVYLMQNLRLRGRSPPIIFARIVRPMNALQLCPWQFSHRCYSRGTTSENRSKNGDFAPTQSLWNKISGTRGRPPPIIFARLVRHNSHMWRTDGQTDRILIARPHLHSMQRGKNQVTGTLSELHLDEVDAIMVSWLHCM